MKHLILTTVFLITGLLTHGQSEKLDVKAIQKNLAEINNLLYASKFEVTNSQYLTFLKSLKKSGQNERYLAAQIDSTKWSSKLPFNSPYIKYYHSHSAYADYPVVNISFEGATLFCEWLTEQYNSNEKRKFKRVKFRLPTKEEWITAAKGGKSSAIYPWDGTDLQNKKGEYRCNFNRSQGDAISVPGQLSDNAEIMAPSAAYWPNNFGLYNMSGNVAEMLSEKGYTKGGSWKDTEETMKIDSESKYFDTPMPTVGFRYFMDLIEK